MYHTPVMSARTIRLSQITLIIAGLIASVIAATILVAPDAFYAGYGIEVGNNPTLANELKAPAAGLLFAGLMILAGAFRRELMMASLITATVVYLAYGFGRTFSILVDGMPHSGMVSAAVIELVIGAICFANVLYLRRRENHGANGGRS